MLVPDELLAQLLDHVVTGAAPDHVQGRVGDLRGCLPPRGALYCGSARSSTQPPTVGSSSHPMTARAALSYTRAGTPSSAGSRALRKFSPAKQARVKELIDRYDVLSVLVASLMPPPFPFSAFVLAAGAAKTDRRMFFMTLLACRLLRFGVEALLGLRYGRYALQWIESETVERVVAVIVIAAIAASVVSLSRLSRRGAPVVRGLL